MDLQDIQNELYLLEKKVQSYNHSGKILLQDEVKIKKEIMDLSITLLKITSSTISERWRRYLLKRRIQRLYLKIDSLKTIYN
ncbi:hypothetical protein [Staphylococcus phage PT94]